MSEVDEQPTPSQEEGEEEVAELETDDVSGGAAAAGGPTDTDGDTQGEAAASDDEEDEVDELAQARTEAAENYDRYLRAAAELENFRKRTIKLRSEAREDTVRDVVLQFAPLLDNMRRALAQETDDAKSLKQGVELISNQFQGILKGYGLEEIKAVGEVFDPNLHEAMMEVPSNERPPGTILEEMEKGYRLRDKVIRPSRVVVAKAEVAVDAAAEENAESESEDEETDG